MSRVPIVIGTVGILAVLVSLATFWTGNDSVDSGAAAMAIFGVLGGSLVGLSGLLLVRAPWARVVLSFAIATSALLASSSDTSGYWLSIGIAGVAFVGLWGPWLTLWLRRAPNADELGWAPVVLLSGAFWMPMLIAAGSWDGLKPMHWVLAVVVMFSSWAYGRGFSVGLWGFRIVVPLLGAGTVAVSTTLGAVTAAAGAIFLASVAWNRRARMVTAVITPPLRPPVVRREH